LGPDGILQMIEEVRCDLVVMGTHGRTGLSRALMGSVAEYVLPRASCPVLVVKPFQPGLSDRSDRHSDQAVPVNDSSKVGVLVD
jgi:hypothetical protein